MTELEIKANAEQYALSRITSTDLSTQARDKILIQDAYEKGFNDCYAMTREENGTEWLENAELEEAKEIIRKYLESSRKSVGFEDLEDYYRWREVNKKAEAFLKE